jgi:hypothetical protein
MRVKKGVKPTLNHAIISTSSDNFEVDTHNLKFNPNLDVHGSVHRKINLIERTDKLQPCSRIYCSIVS